MSLSGSEDKEITTRMQNTSNENHPIQIITPPPPPDQINITKTRTLDPNSGGSKPNPNPTRTNYRECQKNHAANIGGNITDGCGEFMPSGEDGTLEALKCAACNCHRNFHRKELASSNVAVLHLPPPPSSIMSQHHRQWTPSMVQPVKMAAGIGSGGAGSVGTDSSSEELNYNFNNNNSANTYHHHSNAAIAPPPPQFGMKKRHRTKFTTDQKEKMLDFAEKLGWRIPREDDAEVQRFCAEVGVKRQVFKVWMHNNKSTSSSKKTSTNNNNPQEFQI